MRPRAGFAWLEPLSFSNEALAELRKLKLNDELIEQLRDALEVEAQAVADRREDARLGDVRKELKAIAKAADALRQLIENCDKSTALRLADISRKDRVPQELTAHLERLASGCRVRADSKPVQSERSPEGLNAVAIAADVAKAAGIPISEGKNSKFPKLARVACEAVGITDDPRRAIERLLKPQPKNPTKP